MKKLHIPKSSVYGRVACRHGSRPSRSATVRPVDEATFLAVEKERRCSDCEAILERRMGNEPARNREALLAVSESIRAGIKAAIPLIGGAEIKPT